MPTVRINIKVSASEPIPESLGGTFQVEADSVIGVYRVLRQQLFQYGAARVPENADEDSQE